TVRELVPRIDRDYRTDARPKSRAVGGASMGGIAAAGLALEHPELFGAALCQSGAFQVRDGFVLRLPARQPPKPLRFWIDVGLYKAKGGCVVAGLPSAVSRLPTYRSSGCDASASPGRGARL